MREIPDEDFPTLDGIIYLACEFCENWKDGDGPCQRGFKPEEFLTPGGPNESLHYRKQCFYKSGKPKNWIRATDIETHFVNRGLFDCNASQAAKGRGS